MFEELVAEAATVSVDGWDFSWLDGRATEQRPSWGYQRLLGERLAGVHAALGLETGGGGGLGRGPALPPLVAGAEARPPDGARGAGRVRAGGGGRGGTGGDRL